MSMNTIPERLAHLDDLIVKLTKPPVTVELRNQVWLVVQDIEAIAEDVKLIAKEIPAQQQSMARYRDLTEKLFKLHKKYRKFYRDDEP
jgi:hypothetical protein